MSLRRSLCCSVYFCYYHNIASTMLGKVYRKQKNKKCLISSVRSDIMVKKRKTKKQRFQTLSAKHNVAPPELML